MPLQPLQPVRTRCFFQCGLGHMIGLDVHDMEDLGEPLVVMMTSEKKQRVWLEIAPPGQSIESRIYFNG